jgi:hypothetical protein
LEKGDIGLGIFGGNLLYILALMMPISLTAFGVKYNHPFRISALKASRISVQIIVLIWREDCEGADVFLASTSMVAWENYLTKNFNRPSPR